LCSDCRKDDLDSDEKHPRSKKEKLFHRFSEKKGIAPRKSSDNPNILNRPEPYQEQGGMPKFIEYAERAISSYFLQHEDYKYGYRVTFAVTQVPKTEGQ
jgi:hypothetical protein